ncbi:hypothetical protein GALMADRAFT_905210 [Galerina marginata CBS 339.88]|uniref:Uncharacterized protein n=1 Tax=Galerina marginata (strain CBS 339.88) TaxID=685588 RepID=A0A067SQX8_GALM3|nr:hypothetical protein GALMADRAFT_905210 [Galerina marginata CBS 339.88]
MSARKKKSVKSLQGIHALILEHLSIIKPLLDDPKNLPWSSMTEKLTQITSLAESFMEQRSKSSKATWGHLADSLDHEGLLHEVITPPYSYPTLPLKVSICGIYPV